MAAAILLGDTNGVRRFPGAGYFARFNGSAPHRCFQRGGETTSIEPSRKPPTCAQHHPLHIAAITQIPNDTPGRAYYLRKLSESHSRKETRRSLKRRTSDAVYRCLIADAREGAGRKTRDGMKAA